MPMISEVADVTEMSLSTPTVTRGELELVQRSVDEIIFFSSLFFFFLCVCVCVFPSRLVVSWGLQSQRSCRDHNRTYDYVFSNLWGIVFRSVVGRDHMYGKAHALVAILLESWKM